MARWKKQDNRKYSAQYLHFKENEQKEITVSDWDFTKTSSNALFKCYVIKENGKEVDKIWTVWSYETANALKKKLGTKYVSGSRDLKVVMHKDDEDENYFDLL